MKQRLTRSADEQPEGWIYLIACQEPQAMKIGFTTKDPRARVRQLQTGNPNRLILLGWYPGTQRDEQRLHARLQEFRLTGEWFRIDPAANDILNEPVLLARINNALSGYEPGSAR